jgi:DNA-binding NtrC family response regulator
VDSTVLITGESGTGKDLLARAIHSGGKRAKQAFVTLSCCAIPQPLVESELFGHEKGAFTGATERRIGKMQAADHGTLFLDEIGEMPIEAQTKLLRVLQDGRFYPVGSTKVIEVDLRFICATNRSLPEAIAKGTFREDLYYRINVLPIEMPPLRRRREDIPKLAARFIAKHAPRVNAKSVACDPQAMARLVAYPWPGNVRELENTIERVLVCHRTESVITAECLRGILPEGTEEAGPDLGEFDGLPIEEAVARLERRLITRALERAGNVQSRASELLGTTRRILKYKMDQLGIDAGTESE